MNDGLSDTGLPETEARRRLERDGANRLPSPEHRSAWAVLRIVLTQPMVLLLLTCMGLYAVLGSLGDAAMLLVSVVVVASISLYQDLRTQRVLEALGELASPRSTVIRDGVARRLSSQELVVDDRLVVQEGDRIACDARLVVSHGMRLDESMLTGESVPVDKLEPGEPLHAGTLVVQGDGIAIVTATGVRTQLGRLGTSLRAIGVVRTRLDAQLRVIVQRVAVAALGTCLLVAIVFAWRQGSWASGLLVGLTLAMAIIPEEFAVVWAVMLAIGAWRLSRLNVLTRRPEAIEALGTTTVLCVDKTGTLTANRMAVVGLHDGAMSWTPEALGRPPATFDDLLDGAIRASVLEGIEPMDQAILALRSWRCGDALHVREGVLPGRPYVQQAWRSGAVETWAMKGAPEAVLARCDESEAPRLEVLRRQSDAWAAAGLRVIAVARKGVPVGADPESSRYAALGLVAFQDPLREDVPAAVRACADAGVRVVMITGDAPSTAWSIAHQAGIVDGGAADDRCLTGSAVEAMDDEALARTVGRVAVYARVSPAQKLRIVRALQGRGEVVAMTGDGVNDGPALRAADIGVAMGQRGTDVAREAAALVLLDDRFGSLVDAVREGRRVYTNLRKAIGYLFAVHVPIVGVSLLPALGGPVLLWPVHVVLLELIIDPACSLVFEAEAAPPDTMTRRPRPVRTPLLTARDLWRALAVGGSALAVTGGAQALAQAWPLDDARLRLLAFSTIVAGNLLMIRVFRGPMRTRLPSNRVADLLILAVCAAAVPLLTSGWMGGALGFPVDLPSAVIFPVFVALALPAAWRLRRTGARRSAADAAILKGSPPP